MEDYYAILGVPPTASEEQIKQAYRRLIKVWHPDVCTKPNAHEQSVKIIEAHKILSDPQTRGEYDRLRRYGRRAHTHGDRTAYSNRESAFAKTQEAARRHAEEFVQKKHWKSSWICCWPPERWFGRGRKRYGKGSCPLAQECTLGCAVLRCC